MSTKPQILYITDRAIAQIKQLLKAKDQYVGLRVKVTTGGCSGVSYKLEYVENPNPQDEIVVKGGVTVFVDSSSIFYLLGSQMDFKDEISKSSFVFSNPNEKNRCGCGNSFSV